MLHRLETLLNQMQYNMRFNDLSRSVREAKDICEHCFNNIEFEDIINLARNIDYMDKVLLKERP